jgi:hypothetical protein
LPIDLTSQSNAADCAPAQPAASRAQTKGQVIDVARIEAALELVAILLDENEAYLPIFLRLEAELEAARVSSSALARARALAKQARAR